MPSPAVSTAWPKPRSSIAIAGAEEPGPPMTAGASNCEPTSRRATICGPRRDPGGTRPRRTSRRPRCRCLASRPPRRPGPRPCCGASETLSPVIRRAKIAPASPQVATALPSAETATRDRPAPSPAARVGSTSSGCGTPSQVVPWRRTATTSDPPRARHRERRVRRAVDAHVDGDVAQRARRVGEQLRRRQRAHRAAGSEAAVHAVAGDPDDDQPVVVAAGHGGIGRPLGDPGVDLLGAVERAVEDARDEDVRDAAVAPQVHDGAVAVAAQVDARRPRRCRPARRPSRTGTIPPARTGDDETEPTTAAGTRDRRRRAGRRNSGETWTPGGGWWAAGGCNRRGRPKLRRGQDGTETEC